MAEVKRHGLTELYAPSGAVVAEYGGLMSSRGLEIGFAAVSYLCMGSSAIHISLGPRSSQTQI